MTMIVVRCKLATIAVRTVTTHVVKQLRDVHYLGFGAPMHSAMVREGRLPSRTTGAVLRSGRRFIVHER